MRAYKVTTTVPGTEDTAEKKLTSYAASQTEAGQIKKGWLEEHGLKRSHPVRVDPVDIPTGKADLIPWINKNLG